MPIGFVGRGVGPPQPDAGAYRVVSLDLGGRPIMLDAFHGIESEWKLVSTYMGVASKSA